MKLFDTYDKKMKDIDSKNPTMYVCGPTVYNYIHIGNARPLIVFDVLHRLWKQTFDSCTYISNFTDIDDKIIAQAKKENKSESEISEKYITAFKEDLASLNVLEPTHQLKVTEHIKEIIDFIDKLVKQGAAYVVDGDVFFDVKGVKDYGKLSNKDIDQLLANEDVVNTGKKKNPADFVLWKQTGDGIKWDSPWGPGRPGWHTECVVLINKITDKKLDLHAGGVDLKFPHHENEIAQSLAYNKHNLANVWMHNGHINIDSQKMSKSLGNFKLVRDILKNVSANALRWFMLKTSVSSPIDFTKELIDDADKEVEKTLNAYKQAYVKLTINNIKVEEAKFKNKNKYLVGILEPLQNNFNTSNALSELIALARKMNVSLRNNDLDELKTIVEGFQLGCLVMGISIPKIDITKDDLELFNQYEKLRSEKNYDKADVVRGKLMKRGLM